MQAVNGTVKVDLNKEKGVVTFSDSNRVKLVYTSPVALIGNKTVPLNIESEGSSSSIVVQLPELSYPLVVAFGVSGKLPESKAHSRNISFPSFKFNTSGNIELPEDEKEDKPKTTTSTTSTSPSTTTSTSPSFRREPNTGKEVGGFHLRKVLN